MNINKNLKPIVPPIILSTTFAQIQPAQEGYSRFDNPTRQVLENKLASLEKGKFALAFSSGSAAGATVLANFKAGYHVLCSQDVYEGTFRLLTKVFSKFNLKFSLVDMTKPVNIEKSISKNTKLIWLENLTNPLLKIVDIRKVCKIAKRRGVKVLVDNTFTTPVFQNPLKLGADIVLHSLTKYIGGHHDVTAGAIILNDKKLFKKIKFLQHTIGAVPSSFDCFLVLRGIKTLSIRMKKHQENARKIVKFLKSSKEIKKVIFPGFSGMIAFWIEGDKKRTVRFLKKLKLIKIAQSLGGPETIVQHPTSMITFPLSKSDREKIGLTDNLIRMSVGLEENHQSIINDLKQALN